MKTCPLAQLSAATGKSHSDARALAKSSFRALPTPTATSSETLLEQLKEKYVDHPKTAYIKKKKTTKKKAATPRKQKAYTLSKELQAVVEATELSRPEVTKALWVYIKKHNLQDQKNKRLIIPDNKLAAIFGSPDPVDMMKLAGLLTKHLK